MRIGKLSRVLADHHCINPPWRRRQWLLSGLEQLLESLVARGKKPETAELAKGVAMPWRKTCPVRERMMLVSEYLEGRAPMSVLCKHYGVSRRVAYK